MEIKGFEIEILYENDINLHNYYILDIVTATIYIYIYIYMKSLV